MFLKLCKNWLLNIFVEWNNGFPQQIWNRRSDGNHKGVGYRSLECWTVKIYCSHKEICYLKTDACKYLSSEKVEHLATNRQRVLTMTCPSLNSVCMVWDSVQLFSLSVIDQSKICLKGILISDMWILLQNVFFLMISKGMISKGFVIMANHCSLWFKHFFIVCNFNFWGFCYRQGNFFERSFWGKFLLFCWQLTNIEVIVSPSKLRIIILMLYVMCYARKKCYILVTNTETLWHVSTCKVMRTLVF